MFFGGVVLGGVVLWGVVLRGDVVFRGCCPGDVVLRGDFVFVKCATPHPHPSEPEKWVVTHPTGMLPFYLKYYTSLARDSRSVHTVRIKLSK